MGRRASNLKTALLEVGNTLARRFPAQASPWLAALVKFDLPEAPFSDQWLRTALQLTEHCGSTFYDAASHAVALVHNGQFVTADEEYVERAQNEGGIVLLADWKPPAALLKPRR